MEDAHRWSVTYTNHVKQKRKVYHDGFLVLQSSRHKVMLYDEWDKLLETRFVRKDDVIKSGEMVTFGSHLVDIGDLCGGHQGTSISSCQEDRKVSEKSGSLCSSNSQNRKPMFGKSKGRVINLSPSHKMIRDFRKSEMNKFGSSPNCVDVTNASTREWQVLYTTQITQKAKKFHDGFLELIVRGSQGRQVKLYDINRRHLDSRFLKKDETVRSGESLAFEGHLVEIGEQEGDHKPLTDLAPQGKNCKVVVKIEDADHQVKIPTNKKLCTGKIPDSTSKGKFTNRNDPSSKNENPKLIWSNAGPKRAVNDILSILRQPIESKVVPIQKPLTDKEMHSSDSQSNTENHIQDPVSANGRDPHARSSSFCLRSETTNYIAPTMHIECNNHDELNAKDQMTIESATLTRSNENEEPENSPLMNSREGIITETNTAPINGLSSSRLPKLQKEENASSSPRRHKTASCVAAVASNDCTPQDLSGVEEKTTKQDFHTNEMDDFPSFDLGI